MKITKKALKQLIKEELENTLNEEDLDPEMGGRPVYDVKVLSELQAQTVLLRQISVALNAGADVP